VQCRFSASFQFEIFRSGVRDVGVLTEPFYHKAGIEIFWQLQDDLPLVTGDRYGLAQVFLNLSLK
jgi:hypothetical protein